MLCILFVVSDREGRSDCREEVAGEHGGQRGPCTGACYVPNGTSHRLHFISHVPGQPGLASSRLVLSM